MGRLDGQVAIVTGGPASVCAAIVGRLVSEGARVFVGAADQRDVAELAVSLGHNYVDGVPCNPSEEADVSAAVERCVRRFGRLDFACNLISLEEAVVLQGLPPDDFMIALNQPTTGALLCIRYETQQMVRAGRGGRVLLITEPGSGEVPERHAAPARAPVSAVVLGPEEHRIRVSLVRSPPDASPASMAELAVEQATGS